MERKFSVYRLTSPSGGMYVGITSTSMKDRWRGHLRLFKSDVNHPLYNAMRKYGPESFTTEILHEKLTQEEAEKLEILHISTLPKEFRYNISDGANQANFNGSFNFWAKMNCNPELKAQYIAKLSAIKKANDWSDYKKLTALGAEWRKQNPKLAYKLSRRAIRIATKAQNRTTAPPDTRTLLEKLRWKHNRSKATELSAKALWGRRTDEEKADVCGKISAKAKARLAAMTAQEKAEITKKARASVNRKVQGPAASKGLKNFWAELKKNPEKYRAYMDARTESLMKTISKQKQLNDENLRHN